VGEPALTINGADSTLAWSLAWYAYKFPHTFPGLSEEVKAEVCAVPLKGIGEWIKRHDPRQSHDPGRSRDRGARSA